MAILFNMVSNNQTNDTITKKNDVNIKGALCFARIRKCGHLMSSRVDFLGLFHLMELSTCEGLLATKISRLLATSI